MVKVIYDRGYQYTESYGIHELNVVVEKRGSDAGIKIGVMHNRSSSYYERDYIRVRDNHAEDQTKANLTFVVESLLRTPEDRDDKGLRTQDRPCFRTYSNGREGNLRHLIGFCAGKIRVRPLSAEEWKQVQDKRLQQKQDAFSKAMQEAREILNGKPVIEQMIHLIPVQTLFPTLKLLLSARPPGKATAGRKRHNQNHLQRRSPDHRKQQPKRFQSLESKRRGRSEFRDVLFAGER